MFEILPNPSLDTLLIAGRALALIGAFWIFAMAFSRWRRADERSMLALKSQLDRSQAELRALHETITVMSSRIDSLGDRAADVEPRSAPVAKGGNGSLGYDIATRLARNGASVEELVSSCGITRHEAELLLRVQGAHREERRTPTPRNQRAAAAPERQQSWEKQVASREAAPQPQQNKAAARKRGSMLSVVG
jgi:hypothetical protein